MPGFDTPLHKGIDCPCWIAFIHYRRRLADPDGLSIKAALDGIVQSGLLPDDTAKEIAEIRHKQIKVTPSQEEKTVIAIGSETEIHAFLNKAI